MGITSKDVQMYVWVFLEFSMRLCCTLAREHPLASLVFLIIVVLYVFLSTIFWFLIYSLPVVLIAGLIIKVKYFPECPKDKDAGAEKRENNADPTSPGKLKLSEDEEEKKKKAIGRAQSVRRRKSKKDFPPYVEEDGGSIFPPVGISEHEMFDKSPLTEENMKDIREVEVEVEVEVHSVSDRGECSSSDASQSLCVEGLSKGWRKAFRIAEESDNEMTDSSENEGGRRDRSKGMRWSEEDQKSLMDLSEKERNKRLESMMARRRARRLVSLHVRRTLMNIGSDDPPISTIVIPRTNAGSSGPFSPTPGSAPSVLLPTHNPFDLPYDQHEEKPNLRGGSFHQDFMVPNQDLIFCRHESFTLGPSYSEDFNSDFPPRFKVFEMPESYRPRTPFVNKEDAADRVIEQVSVEEPEELNRENTSDVKEQASADREEDGSEVQIKSVLIEDIDDRTSSSSSEEDDEPFYRIDKDAILKSLSTPSSSRNITVDSPESLNPGPSMSQKARMEEHYYYANGAMLPTPSHSVASDLQVEVSEVGSPPRSVDGASSLEEEISVYNRELEKDTPTGNECTLVSSSRPSRLDENESRSREVREVTEQEDLIKSGFSNINPTLHIPPERVIQQDPVDSSSFPDSQAYKSGESSASIEENDILELVKRNSHTKTDAELAISEDCESPADLEASFQPEPVFEQAHIASAPSLMSEVENDTSNLLLNDQMAQGDKTGENSMSVEKNDVREVTQERAVEPPSERGFSAANQSGHGPQTTLLIPESGDEQVPDMSSSSASPKSRSIFSIHQDSSSNLVSKIHSEDQQYGFAERSTEDLGSSVVNQSSDDPESVVGEISTSSSTSSSSSPSSISQTKFSLDLGSPNWDQEPQMEVPQSQNQIAETTHQVTYEISNPTTSQHESGQLLADIPTLPQQVGLEISHVSSQESSNDHKKSSDEASSDTHVVNASMIQEREILNPDSTEETKGLPELETTARRSESYDHDRSSEATRNNHINPLVIHEDTQNKDSIVETKGVPKLEISAHHSEPHDREKYSEETSTINHNNASVIPEEILKIDYTEETERLHKPEMTTNRLESNDHEKSSKEISSDNHTNASVIPEEILKIDCTEETERLSKPEMTANRLESNNHEKSSKEISSDNHTNALVIQEKEIQSTDSSKEAEGPPKLDMTEGELPHLNEERGPQGHSMAENKGAKMTEGAVHLEGTVQKPVSEETSTSNHTNASVIPEEILKIDCTEETERLPKTEMTANHLESNDHEKSSNETRSDDNHTNAPVIQEKEIQSTDSIKEAGGSPKLELTEGELPHLNEERGHPQGPSMAENKGDKLTEGVAHLEGTVQKLVAEETSSNNHINPSVIHEEDTQNKVETKGLPKIETSAHNSESHDHEKYSEETGTSSYTNASVIPEEILKTDCTEETERLPKPEMTTNCLEPNDHEKSSEETSSDDNHTNASVIQPVAAVKSDVNNVVESESRSFTVNEVSNFDVSKVVSEKSDSTHSANSIEREATPYLSEKPVENEREIPNLNTVNKENDEALSFQGSHKGESSRELSSVDSVNKPPQTSQSVHPSKVQDPDGEHRIQNEADAVTSTSRLVAGKDHDSQDSEKPMNSENAADHLKANEAYIGSGERDHSNTNLKD